MLCIIFEVDGERYGLDANQIVEIVPFVSLSPLEEGPDYLVGAMDYRGQAVPVLDIRMTTKGEESPRQYSTRILIVDFPLESGSTRLGLLTPRLIESRSIQDSTDDLGITLKDAPYLGAASVEGGRVVHLLKLEGLLPPEVCEVIFP